MGGGSGYDGDVAERASSSSRFREYERRMERAAPRERRCHPSLNPHGKIRECRDIAEHPNTTPIALVNDVTESRAKDREVVNSKTPMLMGQIVRNGYAPDPEICIVGYGDTTCDIAPIQVGQFESTNVADKDMKNIWPERGGGGTGQESAQLVAYFFAYRTELDCVGRGKKGFLFFFTDEGFYGRASKEELKRHLGVDVHSDVPATKIFKDLQKKFHVFMIFPKKSWEERKTGIDNEIKQRVERAGGLVEGVDLRFSLVWGNTNDLDLHVQTPDGFHIHYRAKQSPCGGFLDVDMNAHEVTTKPVENVRWKKGKARPGEYRVWVENFRERMHEDTPFTVEIENDGEVTHFEGKIKRGTEHDRSRVDVGRFEFRPAVSQIAGARIEDRRYELYKDDVVIDQWSSVIPKEQILRIDDPKAAIDVVLGAIAITNGVRDLEGYIKDVMDRPLEENGVKYKPQTPERIQDIRNALADYAALHCAPSVNVASIPSSTPKLDRKSQSKRL